MNNVEINPATSTAGIMQHLMIVRLCSFQLLIVIKVSIITRNKNSEIVQGGGNSSAVLNFTRIHTIFVKQKIN